MKFTKNSYDKNIISHLKNIIADFTLVTNDISIQFAYIF